MHHPDWLKHATVYQLNQRQLTPEGTLRAAEAHLPRIRDLGVEVVWLMPVHPIGEVNRKGTLGSPYAVRDHTAVHPDLGSTEDLRHFVEVAHDLGLKVILDWVANHTAWDHVWVEEHPEWYARDWKGDLRPTPWWDWDDIVDLDYDQPGLREQMAAAMELWVRECDVDGYRCDVAGFVPLDFWEDVRRRLDAIKPVFMLAEWETRDLHRSAFDASYAWSWNEAVAQIAGGTSDLEPLRVYYAWNECSWPDHAMRMTFVSNHDHNSAVGTEHERFGDALDAVIVLSFVGDGIPLVYTGQELGNRRRLAFFDKDVVDIGDDSHQADLYRALIDLKKRTPALWNAGFGAPMVRVPTDQEGQVLAFVRADATSRVLAVLNLGATACTVTLGDGPQQGRWVEPLGEDPAAVVEVGAAARLELEPWEWRVLAGEAVTRP